MNRRSFIKSSTALTGAAAVTLPSSGIAAENSLTPTRQFIELRRYQLRRGPMQKRFDDFYRTAAIPAMNRAGITPVGVFGVVIGPDNPTMYALLPHASMESFAASLDKIRKDEEFLEAGEEFLNIPPTDPSYIRVESILFRAFETMPKVEVPAQTTGKKPRIFEMRTYEAHSKKASMKKIEMFDRGEIAIFRKNGLTPVFFGESLIGPKQPNLTYMLVYDNMTARDENWGKFIADPDWKKLSTTPGYTDPEILTNITSVFLRPTIYSQI